MDATSIVEELRLLGSSSILSTLQRHGAQGPAFGVKIEDLKKIQKRIKRDYQLALDLYNTGIYDAMYLAGLIAEDSRMTREDLRHWVEMAHSPMLSEYTVPWVAAESMHGDEMAHEWIESDMESVAASGWATLSGLVALKEDAELDIVELTRLIHRVEETIHCQPNRVRRAMNGFLISVGVYVAGLTDLVLQSSAKIGAVSVDMGGTACKVPSAAEYIRKVQARGSIGKKRKTVKC